MTAEVTNNRLRTQVENLKFFSSEIEVREGIILELDVSDIESFLYVMKSLHVTSQCTRLNRFGHIMIVQAWQELDTVK